MWTFITAHLVWFILIGTTFIFVVGGISLVQSFLVSQRLHFLTMDVLENDPKSFQHMHVIMCHTCKSKRHVSQYRYGWSNAMKSVYLCYLCVPRFEKHLRTVCHPASMAPTESTKDASYAHFQAWTGQNASSSTSPTDPYSYRVPQHQAHKKGW